VVGTGTVGTGTVGAGAVVVGAAVGVVVVGVVVVGGVYLGTVVTGGLEVGVVVVRAVITACAGVVVVVLVEPVARTGISACAVRAIEPKALLSLAFWASSLVSRSTWTARSCLSAAIAAASVVVDGCAAREAAAGRAALPSMAFEARSMYCLALAESCLAR
jgi:hypothetical protein